MTLINAFKLNYYEKNLLVQIYSYFTIRDTINLPKIQFVLTKKLYLFKIRILTQENNHRKK